jgi:hypothetical protein
MGSFHKTTKRWDHFIKQQNDGIISLNNKKMGSFHKTTKRWDHFIKQQKDGIMS